MKAQLLSILSLVMIRFQSMYLIRVVHEADAKVRGCRQGTPRRARTRFAILISPLWCPVKVCGSPAGSHASAPVTETRALNSVPYGQHASVMTISDRQLLYVDNNKLYRCQVESICESYYLNQQKDNRFY